MTTVIACRPLLTMVSDSRVSHGGGRFMSRKKVQKAGKFLAGVSGDYTQALAYLKLFVEAARVSDAHNPPTMPAYENEFELLVMSEAGIWIYGVDGTPVEVEDVDYYAIGSGGAYAAGALAAQERFLSAYDLEMAMEIACEQDTSSALPMVSITLERKRRSDAARNGA